MSKKVWYILLGVFAVVFLCLAVTMFFMRYPAKCQFGCALAPSFMNGPLCLSVKETNFDATIVKPSPQPYLGGFNDSAGAGPPFCEPVWYAFRYVRNIDGEYGPLSNWSGSSGPTDLDPQPIYSGASTLPCAAPGCSAWGITLGNDTCTYNQPTIVLTGPLDFDVNFGQLNGYTLNVHRQVGYVGRDGIVHGFDSRSEGDIVGSFLVEMGNQSSTAKFIDAVFNPKSTTSSTCC